VNPDDSLMDRGDDAARPLAIDLEELIWALNSRDPLGEGSHWLNLESGELLYLCGFDAEDDAEEDPRDSDHWLRVEPVESSQAFEIMEDFTGQCRDARLARALAQALQQRKPFRRFKDTLAAHPEQRDAWFAFEREAMEVIARRWCEDHGISPRWTSPRDSTQRTPSG
jgi:Uncharacterised protein family (UPF0158)